MKKNWIMIAVAVVIAAGCFYGGMVYGKNSAQSGAPARGGNFAGNTSGTRGAFAGRGGAAGAGGGFVAGTISSVDSSSITLQLPNGNSQVIFYSSSTDITKPAAASISDLTSGTSVTIGGTANSDGSLTATAIQIRPAGTAGPGFGGGVPRNRTSTAPTGQ